LLKPIESITLLSSMSLEREHIKYFAITKIRDGVDGNHVENNIGLR
jgi:hypothetical protein